MCNFTCAISKRNRVSAQNPRIQGRSCQRPAERPQSPRGRSHTFTQKGPLFHSFSLWTGSTMGELGTGSTKGAVFRCVVGSCSAGARWVNRVTGSKWVNKGQAPQRGRFFDALLGRAPRDRSCARREARGRWAFALCARGVWIASSACFGPVPLPLCACWVWRLGANGISHGRIRRACGRRCRFGQGGCRGCRVRRYGRGRGRGGGRRCGRC